MGNVWGMHGNHVEARERQYLSIYCLLLDIFSVITTMGVLMILSQNCWAVGDVGGMGTTLRPVESHGLHCVAASSRSPSVPSSLPRPLWTETPPPIIFLPENRIQTNLWANYKPSIVLPTSSPNNTKLKLFQGKEKKAGAQLSTFTCLFSPQEKRAARY